MNVKHSKNAEHLTFRSLVFHSHGSLRREGKAQLFFLQSLPTTNYTLLTLHLHAIKALTEKKTLNHWPLMSHWSLFQERQSRCRDQRRESVPTTRSPPLLVLQSRAFFVTRELKHEARLREREWISVRLSHSVSFSLMSIAF